VSCISNADGHENALLLHDDGVLMSGANARVDGEVVDDDIMVATLNELVNERSMLMMVMRIRCVFFFFHAKMFFSGRRANNCRRNPQREGSQHLY